MSESSNHRIDVESHGHVTVITLSNPPTHTMVAAEAAQLHDVLDVLESEPTLRVLILTGGSEDIFVRHYEVGELVASSERLQGDTLTPARTLPEPDRGLRGVILRLEAMDVVTIAAINGSTMGGGLELALGCDFRLLRDGDYRLGLPETGVGILPGGGGTQRLARLLGVARALDLILHGEVFGPERALELGVVSRVLPHDDFMTHVMAFAKQLARRAPKALANAKRAIREGIEMPLTEGLAREGELFGERMRTEDAMRAMRATLAGEPLPEFKGR